MAKQKDAIEDVATQMLASNRPIVSARQVREAVQSTMAIKVDDGQVRQVMRKEMRLGYREVRTVPIQSNSERCLVLRQQYALRLLPLLESGCFSKEPTFRIINVDESWLNGTRFLRRMWAPTDAPATVTDKQVAPRVSLIAALDTEGRVWSMLTHSITDTNVMTAFLRHLARQLDSESPGWQDESTILLDNAAWHSNTLMKRRLATMQLPIMFSAPYSYSTAPIVSIHSISSCSF